MKKLVVVLIAVALVAIVAAPVMAGNATRFDIDPTAYSAVSSDGSCVNLTVIEYPQRYAMESMSCVQQSDVEYPEEYYQYNRIVNSAFTYLGDIKVFRGKLAGEYPQIATMYELRMQTILLERHNKLLAEQNELMRKHQKMSLVCNEMSSYSGCYSYVWREL